MALGYSTALNDAILNAFLNGGSGFAFLDSAVIEFRTTPRAASADTAPTGTLLSAVTLPADAMSAPSARACSKVGTWEDLIADATGEVAWFRIRTSGDLGTTNTTDQRWDGSVTATGGGGDLTVSATAFVAGHPIVVDTFSVTLPA